MYQYKLTHYNNLVPISPLSLSIESEDWSIYRLPMYINDKEILEMEFVFKYTCLSTQETYLPPMRYETKSRFALDNLKVVIFNESNIRLEFTPVNGVVDLSHLPHGIYVMKLFKAKKEIYKTLFYPPK